MFFFIRMKTMITTLKSVLYLLALSITFLFLYWGRKKSEECMVSDSHCVKEMRDFGGALDCGERLYQTKRDVFQVHR